jgi:hypothetical protein
VFDHQLLVDVAHLPACQPRIKQLCAVVRVRMASDGATIEIDCDYRTRWVVGA